MALELVSIHVPKTAGTSLAHSFCQAYGDDRVVSLTRKLVRGNENNLNVHLHPNTRVLHGHFFYSEIDPHILADENIRLIAMVRNPIDRVVSNYHHFIKTTKEHFPGSRKWLRRFESLLKYASREHTQNVLNRYLAPYNWDRFAFIGVQECFAEDLARLSVLLGWDPNTEEYRLNVHKRKKELTQEEEYYLTRWNQEDIKLYEELVSMRNLKKW
ncbi:sulfotransferase family 2 domain-containing protein [Marinoscillum sp.]|uniref:sulfotransferase family 2 domain-containing protein n=1 Tax=Marinoscillum sp. TaxID=2024838 RepID=UPI003BAD704F